MAKDVIVVVQRDALPSEKESLDILLVSTTGDYPVGTYRDVESVKAVYGPEGACPNAKVVRKATTLLNQGKTTLATSLVSKFKIVSFDPASPVVAAAAKLCYSDAHITDLLDGLDEEKTARFLTMLSDLGHASPIEHASFTFGIEGVSRTLLAQITRHRIASFSVQSQRYVRLDDFRYVIPPEIEAIPEAKAAFIESMNEDAQRYLDLVQKLEDGHTARLMAEGMSEKQARAKASKQANEDARFVLPNACETKMVVTMNARSLQNFFHLRCCSRAQWEIRALAEEMLRLVYPVAPHLFAKAGPACVSGPCPEGKMCCGRTAEVRARYAALKGEPQNG